MILLEPQQVAELAGVSLKTLANWRTQGRGPRWLKPSGRRVLYPQEWFDQWLLSTAGGREPDTAVTPQPSAARAAGARGPRKPQTYDRTGRHQTQADRRLRMDQT